MSIKNEVKLFYIRIDKLIHFIKLEKFSTEEIMLSYLDKIKVGIVTEQDVKDVEQLGNNMTEISNNSSIRDSHFYIEGGIMFVVMNALETRLYPTYKRLKCFRNECQIYGIND